MLSAEAPRRVVFGVHERGLDGSEDIKAVVLGVVAALSPLDLGITRSDDTILTTAALLIPTLVYPGSPGGFTTLRLTIVRVASSVQLRRHRLSSGFVLSSGAVTVVVSGRGW